MQGKKGAVENWPSIPFFMVINLRMRIARSSSAVESFIIILLFIPYSRDLVYISFISSLFFEGCFDTFVNRACSLCKNAAFLTFLSFPSSVYYYAFFFYRSIREVFPSRKTVRQTHEDCSTSDKGHCWGARRDSTMKATRNNRW